MTDTDRRKGLNRRKLLISSNILLWVFQGMYVVSPIDLIPDIIPVIGYVDDLLGVLIVFAFTLYTVGWLRRQKRATGSEAPELAAAEETPGYVARRRIRTVST